MRWLKIISQGAVNNAKKRICTCVYQGDEKYSFFQKIWRALFSCYLCLQIRPFALLLTKVISSTRSLQLETVDNSTKENPGPSLEKNTGKAKVILSFILCFKKARFMIKIIETYLACAKTGNNSFFSLIVTGNSSNYQLYW